MIKNIVFDIGGVLIELPKENFFAMKGYSKEMSDRLFRAIAMSPYWAELDRGILSDQEVEDGFVSEDPEIEEDIRACFADLKGLVLPADFAIDWIEDLKARGYKTYFLSNYSQKLLRDCPEATEFLPHLHGGVFSCDVKMNKPEEGIYLALLEKYDLKAEECVFMDDLPQNIAGAKAVGMEGILVIDHEQTAADLEVLLAK